MDRSRKLVVSAAAVFILCLVAIGLPAANAMPDGSRIAMMDDDKMSMKPDASNSSPMNTGPSSSQPQSMSGGRMSDDKMKMGPPGQMQDCQGSGCQNGSSMMPMMQMMEKMMRGQMSSSTGGGAMSGPADVTERLEGRIAFLKAELQISDKQLADWNNLADALRGSRQHLVEARKMLVMDDRTSAGERLEHYERHLSERLEAIKSARSALARLYASLSDTQKQTADAILLPLLATF